MFDLEGVSGAEDVAIVGDESAVQDGLRALFAAGADDILCHEFGETERDRARTRACLVDLLNTAA
jgi:hypothetical protein